jgi:hypothetical protein
MHYESDINKTSEDMTNTHLLELKSSINQIKSPVLGSAPDDAGVMEQPGLGDRASDVEKQLEDARIEKQLNVLETIVQTIVRQLTEHSNVVSHSSTLGSRVQALAAHSAQLQKSVVPSNAPPLDAKDLRSRKYISKRIHNHL